MTLRHMFRFDLWIFLFYSSNHNFRYQWKKETFDRKFEDEEIDKTEEVDPELENEKDEELTPDDEVIEAETETPVIRREVRLSVYVVLVKCVRYSCRYPTCRQEVH